MSDNLEALSARVRALLAKTAENGATEAEAMSAAAKAREMMDKHRLTLTDLEIKAEPIVEEAVERANDVRYAPADHCIWGIDAYCGVKSWYRKRQGVRRLILFGQKPDVEMARYLYEMIAAAIEADCRHWQKSDDYRNAYSRRSASSSFKLGMAERINDRLQQMARDLAPVAKSATGTALVVVKGAAVQAAYDARGLKLRTTSTSMGRCASGDGYAAGRAAGDRVNLSRPVRGGATGLLS